MQLLNVCASFATQTDRFMRNFFISPASILTDATRVSLNTYARIVDKAAEIFDGELLKLMDAVHYMSAIDGDHRMPHLAARLDFSGFYASAFGRGLAEEVAGNAK